MRDDFDRPFPRPVLFAAGAMMLTVVTGTGLVRAGAIAGPPTVEQRRAAAHVQAVEARALRFDDVADGSVAILDAATGVRVATLPPGDKDGFVRGVMRALSRERRIDGVGASPEFRLTRWSDGGLTITDPSTRRSIELGSFGPTNRASFARLLPSGGRA